MYRQSRRIKKQTRKQQRSAKFETIMNHSDKEKEKKYTLITTSSFREIRDEEEEEEKKNWRSLLHY